MRSRTHRAVPTLLATTAFAAAVTTLAAPADAQIQPNRIYGPGERISEPSLGLTLTLIDGWRGALSPDGESFMLESDAGDGTMVVVADEIDEAQARQQMARPMDMGGGIVLRPAGEIREVASGHLTGRYTVTGAPREYEGTVDVRLTESGLGVAFILLSPPTVADAQREEMRAFAFSLGVAEPTSQGASESDEWEPYLRGRYLARFYTATGYTESTELWLCSDGTFHYDSQGGGFGGGASGAMQSGGGGRWSATGAGANGTLILDWASGDRTTLELSYDDQENKLYVGGERMLRGANERCR